MCMCGGVYITHLCSDFIVDIGCSAIKCRINAFFCHTHCCLFSFWSFLYVLGEGQGLEQLPPICFMTMIPSVAGFVCITMTPQYLNSLLCLQLNGFWYWADIFPHKSFLGSMFSESHMRVPFVFKFEKQLDWPSFPLQKNCALLLHGYSKFCSGKHRTQNWLPLFPF